MNFNADILNGLASLGGTVQPAAWKSLVILAVAWGVTLIWRRANPAARHLVWTATFMCLLALPFFGRLTPSWSAPAWVDPAALNSHLPESLQFVLNGSAPQSAEPTTPLVEKKTAAPPSQPLSSTPAPDQRQAVTWGEMATAIWLAGVAIGLLRILTGQIRLHRLARSMRVSDNLGQLQTLREMQSDFRLTQTVQLLIGPELATPMTWGIRRPVVVLPAVADTWTDERLRIVLRHELAHIRRGDCLTQEIARVGCAFYWFNPLTWLAARQMRAEREKACDDFVLNGGARPSEYAGYLVEIARRYPAAAHCGGTVPMARPSGLEQRVVAILDERRQRNAVGKVAATLIVLPIFGLALLLGGCVTGNSSKPAALNSLTSDQLVKFVAEKEAQESQLIKADEVDFAKSYDSGRCKMEVPDCRPFFATAARGDWPAVSNQWSELEAHTMGLGLKQATNGYPHGMWLQPVRETYGAVEQLVAGSEKYATTFGNDIIQSIPPGSIYFGGTDPGRFIVTMMEKSQVNADPFFTLTQNALADGTYLEYLRSMYGGKIYIPTGGDSQKCFETYLADIRKRSAAHQLKPGEHIKEEQGRVQISGPTAVMQINGLLVKTIFDHETNREFYIEESFALDWIYPYLEPHGLIFKINRESLPELSEAMVRQDREYWQPRVAQMIGGWLDDDTSVKDVAAFAEKVFVRHDLNGFTGDPEFVRNDYANKMFSKLRSSIAGLYAWRAEHATTATEKARMARAADFAFRQALALCPGSPEAVQRYTAFLKSQDRAADAQLVQDLADQFKPKPPFFQIRLVVDGPADDAEKMIDQSINQATDQVYSQVLFVQKAILLDQTAIQSAQVEKDALGHRVIDITFTDAGRKQFAQITREHLHQRLAIVIDGKVATAPVIQSEISGGTCQITGSFSEAEAQALTAKINEAIAR